MLRRKSLYCVLVANTYVIIYGCTLSRTTILLRGWPRSWIDKHKTCERLDFSTRNVRRPSITHVGRERFTTDEARVRGTLLQYYTKTRLNRHLAKQTNNYIRIGRYQCILIFFKTNFFSYRQKYRYGDTFVTDKCLNTDCYSNLIAYTEQVQYYMYVLLRNSVARRSRQRGAWTRQNTIYDRS